MARWMRCLCRQCGDPFNTYDACARICAVCEFTNTTPTPTPTNEETPDAR